MLKRTHRKAVMSLCLGTVLAMSTVLGVGYAGWNDVLGVDTTISTGDIRIIPTLETVDNGLWAQTKVSGQPLQKGLWAYDYKMTDEEGNTSNTTNQTDTMAIYRIDSNIFKIAFIVKNTGTVPVRVRSSKVRIEQTRGDTIVWNHTKYAKYSQTGEEVHIVDKGETLDGGNFSELGSESQKIMPGESALFYYQTPLGENTLTRCRPKPDKPEVEPEPEPGPEQSGNIYADDYIRVWVDLYYEHGVDSWDAIESFDFGREVNHEEYKY